MASNRREPRSSQGKGGSSAYLDTFNGEVLLMQTATIQRRIETLPALRSGWKQSGEPCALKGACTVRREALGRPRQRRSAPTLRDRPRAPGGASAPSRARPALAGSPHTEDQDCSWPINRDRPQLDVLVFAPEMLVRPRVPRVQGRLIRIPGDGLGLRIPGLLRSD